MAKAKLFKLTDLQKNLTFPQASLDAIAQDIITYMRQEYLKVIQAIGTPQYSPLHASTTYRGQTYNPNFKSKKTGAYYRAKFQQREALYVTMIPVFSYQIKNTGLKASIVIQSTVEDGMGNANNVYYFLDLGTKGSSTQARSPFYRGTAYAPPSKGIMAKGHSQKVTDETLTYIQKKYQLKVVVTPVTTERVRWNNDVLTKALAKP